jgi:hypothetical protein
VFGGEATDTNFIFFEVINHDLYTSSIVIDRYSNFGNTYLLKEFVRVLGPGQIVTSLEHLAQYRGGSRGVFNLCQHFEISYSRYANKHFITGVYITINDSYR